MEINEKIDKYVLAQGNQVGSGAELAGILKEMVEEMPGPPGPQGPQGPQGNTGSSVDYPFELVNNLTTDDPEKGLSAAQGVVLKGEISQLGQEVDGSPANYELGYYLNAYGAKVADNGYFLSVKIPAVLGDTFVISGAAQFMCTYTSEDAFCDFWSARTNLTITGPANTNAAYIIISFAVANLATAYVARNTVLVWRAENSEGLNSLPSKIKTVVGKNLYNPEGRVLISNETYRYNSAKLSGDEEYVVISSKQSSIDAAYVTKVKFVFADGTTQDASIPTYLTGTRYGLRYAVPSGAKQISFYYKAFASGGVTFLSEIMVTAGASLPAVYEPYSEYNEFNHPYYDGIKDELFAPVYVSTSGDDNNSGEFDSPYASIQRALLAGKPIIVRGGNYFLDKAIDLSASDAETVKVSAYHGERVNIIRGRVISSSDGTLVSGYTKVYSVQVSQYYSYDHKWIYQFGVKDAATKIQDNERTAIHKRKDYRCDFTAIKSVSSIAEVEASEDFAFFYENGTLYYSRPEEISSTKFLFEAREVTFVSASVPGRKLELDGLYFYGATLNVPGCIDSVIRNCASYGCYGGSGISLDRVRNALLENCEVARVEMLGSSPLGDGFNAHTDGDADEKAIRTSFELRNCWSHDNNNDGYSDHEGCEGFINGGLFEHNCIGGQGAGLTPAYGAHDVIKDAICQFNNNHGFLYTGNGEDVQYETGDYGTVQVNSVVSRGNTQCGFVFVSDKQVGDFINCIAYENGDYGFRAVQGIMRCINTLSVDNSTDNYSNVVLVN